MDDFWSGDAYHQLIGRAIEDPEYRESIKSEDGRVEALRAIGVAEPTDAQLDALRKAIESVEELAKAFGIETRAA